MRIIKNLAAQKAGFLLLLGMILAGCLPPGPRALWEGKDLIDRGRYPEAVEQLKAAVSLQNTNALAWEYLGLAYQYAGQTTNAVQAYQKALALNYDLGEAHYNLGCLWLDQNRLDLARTELTTYTALRKKFVEGWLRLGTAQLRSARAELRSLKAGAPPAHSPDLAAAEKSFNEALRLRPQNPEALNGLGLVQLCHNRPRDAAHYFSDALKQQPDYPPALLNLAVVSQLYLNDRRSALEKYREYLALPVHAPDWEPVNAAARDLELQLNLAPPAPATNGPKAPGISTDAAKPAVNSLGQAAGSPASEPAANLSRAATAGAPREAKGETVKSLPEPAAKPARDPTPPSESAGIARAKAAPAPGESPKSEKPGFLSRINPLNLLHRESRTSPNADSAAAQTTASGSRRTARYAYHSLARPASGDTSAAERAFAQGLAAQQAGRFREAIQAYRQATELDPADYDAYYNLGLAAAAAGAVPQALTAYEWALVIRPESADARYNFALLLKQANYPLDAADELKTMLNFYPGEPRAHLALGNLYALQLHQPALARAQYEKVLENDPRNAQAAAIRFWMAENPP